MIFCTSTNLNDPTSFLLYFTGSHCSKLQEQHIKSMLEKSHVFYNNILSKQTEKSLKITSKMILKTWIRNKGGRFEALLGHLWRRSVFLTPKNVNKVLQKWPQGFKIAPKMTPRVQNWAKKHPKGSTLSTKCLKLVKKSSKQLPIQIINWTTTSTVARRTARSAFN